MGWIPYAWASCFSYSLLEAAISEPFRFNVVTVLISGIGLAPTKGSDEQFTSNVLGHLREQRDRYRVAGVRIAQDVGLGLAKYLWRLRNDTALFD
jgi:hypothetical protein